MRDLKISSELASEVLGKEVTKCSLLSTARSSINITYFEDKEDFNTIWKEWNIYEFAFKCKEWAHTKNYELRSWKGYCACVYLLDGYGFNQQDYTARTEIEAVIKACEWILDKEKMK